MNKIIAIIVLVLIAAETVSVTAFTGIHKVSSVSVNNNQRSIVNNINNVPTSSSSFLIPQTTSTSTATSTTLYVKVKVDKKKSDDRMNPAVFRNAAYLGSIAVAVLLPVIFLIWSATKN